MAGSFGASYVALTSAQDRLDFERSAARRDAFDAVDAQLDELVVRALRGERVIEVARPGSRDLADEIELALPAPAQRPAVDVAFAAAQQQARGAWYLPQKGALATGVVHLAHWWRADRRFAMTLAERERVTPNYECADTLAVWSVLIPLFEDLFLPLKLRSDRLAPKTREQQLQVWTKSIDPLYEALGVGTDAVAQYRPRAGWAELGADGVMARRDALLNSWAEADIEAARRLRTYRISKLIERYYSKAKNGQALRRRVMTKELEPILSGYFGGDWLSLLAYLGEEPDANDEVTTALPKARLMVGTTDRVVTVAAAHGIAREEVDRMLASFWNQPDGNPPVQERVGALKRFWGEFHALHARQTAAMHSLWGLMSGPGYHVRHSVGWYGDYDETSAGIAEEVLSGDLLADLRRLWGTKPFKSQERLVSEPSYTAAAVRALGPAFNFWQEIGDSIWFICEGPQSRTDLEGLEQYLRDRRELSRLEATGHPVDREMFKELRAAESKLGTPQETWRDEHQIGAVTMRLGGGIRRNGFEILRDIVASYRGQWAELHLDDYLQTRWKGELVAVSDAYHRFMADRTKPPTVKQFAKMATPACTNWFAGDLTAVYSAVGLKAPIDRPTYSRLLPQDCRGFTMRVFVHLGGNAVKHERFAIDREAAVEQQEESRRNNILASLADESLDWVELAEGLGHPPELTEFGAPKLDRYTELVGDDVNAAWRAYTGAVERALAAVDAADDAGATGVQVPGSPGAVAAVLLHSREYEAAPGPVSEPVPATEAVPATPDEPASAPAPHRRSLRDLLRGK